MQIVIIRAESTEAHRWASALNAAFAPTRMIFAIPAEAEDLPPALAQKPAASEAVAYLCSGMTCSAPLNDLAAVARDLNLRIDQ
jgi:uncharacterized protein